MKYCKQLELNKLSMLDKACTLLNESNIISSQSSPKSCVRFYGFWYQTGSAGVIG